MVTLVERFVHRYWRGSRVACIRRGRLIWAARGTATAARGLSRRRLLHLLTGSITCAILHAGDTFLKQVTGIGMGVIPAAAIARLCAHVCECERLPRLSWTWPMRNTKCPRRTLRTLTESRVLSPATRAATTTTMFSKKR